MSASRRVLLAGCRLLGEIGRDAVSVTHLAAADDLLLQGANHGVEVVVVGLASLDRAHGVHDRGVVPSPERSTDLRE